MELKKIQKLQSEIRNNQRVHLLKLDNFGFRRNSGHPTDHLFMLKICYSITICLRKHAFSGREIQSSFFFLWFFTIKITLVRKIHASLFHIILVYNNFSSTFFFTKFKIIVSILILCNFKRLITLTAL